MPARVRDLDTQTAAPCIEVQSSRLKNGACAAVEVGKVHRVRQELVEILLESDELLDRRDLLELVFECGVLFDQVRDCSVRGAADQLV